MFEWVEFADIKADMLYIFINDVLVRITSPIPYAYVGVMREKVEAGEITFISQKKRVEDRTMFENMTS